MEERGERLKIFNINHQRLPSLAQITLQLCDANDNAISPPDIVDWIADGIKAENDQLVVCIMLYWFWY